MPFVKTLFDQPNLHRGGGIVGLGEITYVCNSRSGGLVVTPSHNNPTCLNFPNGTINIALSGGASPYTYSWSPNVIDSSSATGLSAGTYTISIDDSVNDNVTF